MTCAYVVYKRSRPDVGYPPEQHTGSWVVYVTTERTCRAHARRSTRLWTCVGDVTCASGDGYIREWACSPRGLAFRIPQRQHLRAARSFGYWDSSILKLLRGTLLWKQTFSSGLLRISKPDSETGRLFIRDSMCVWGLGRWYCSTCDIRVDFTARAV